MFPVVVHDNDGNIFFEATLFASVTFILSQCGILQKAGERETILAEILDLDNVKKAREYGNLGLCQLWKQLREYPQEFPNTRTA